MFLRSGSTRRSPLVAYGQSSLVSPFALPYLKAALLFPVSFPARGLWWGVWSRETECKKNKIVLKTSILWWEPIPNTCSWFAHASGRILTRIPAPSTVKTSLRSSQAPCLVPLCFGPVPVTAGSCSGDLCSYRAVQGTLLGTGMWQHVASGVASLRAPWHACSM